MLNLCPLWFSPTLNRSWPCDVLGQRECNERVIVEVLVWSFRGLLCCSVAPCKEVHDNVLEGKKPEERDRGPGHPQLRQSYQPSAGHVNETILFPSAPVEAPAGCKACMSQLKPSVAETNCPIEHSSHC